MHTRITLLTSLAHSGSVHVTTEIPAAPTTQVRTPGVVSLPHFISSPSRSTRRLLQATVTPLPLVLLALYLRLPLGILLAFNQLLACLLVLALFLLARRPLQLLHQFLLLLSLLLSPLLQLTRKPNFRSLRLTPQMLSFILRLLVIPLLVLRSSPPLLSHLSCPPVPLMPTHLRPPLRSLQTTLGLPRKLRRRPRLRRIRLQQRILARQPRRTHQKRRSL